LASLNALVSDVILDPGFNRDDFVSFRAEKELGKLDHYAILKDGVVSPDTWSVDSVEISLPGTRHKFPSKSEAPTFTVEDVYNRNIIDVIGAALRKPDAETFHLFPFELHWKPSNHEPSRRICLELYSSDEFVQAHLEVQGLAHKNNCQHEAVVIGLMLWSDSTQLTQFGSSYLWPIYLFFANQSKYACNKPSSSSSHHIAYIPKLTDSTFKSAYRDIFGTDPSNDIMTHSHWELVHAVYLLLMNKDFMHAYVYGCEFEFWDGIIRQWFPRWFIHATDYPEKSRIPLLGTDRDMRFREKNPRVDRPADVANAEKLLYEKGIALSNNSYNEILKFTSRVPTRSTFSIRLQEHGFDHHSVLAPDLMHESELGVWKALLTHLIRVCQAEKGDTVAELDRRYCAVPTFGRDTIRKFPKSCSTPVFEGLFPAKHNKIIMGVLFEMQTWHSLAKLRAHDVLDSLPDLKASTKRLGKSFREFAKVTCAAYETEELPSEAAARARREALAASKGRSTTGKKRSVRGKKHFSLTTPKLHLLGHYAFAIARLGTTDNYNTQTGELEHHRMKMFLYARAAKGNYVAGIAKQHLRQRKIQILNTKASKSLEVRKHRMKLQACMPFDAVETLLSDSPFIHYQMSQEDPALVDFRDKLKHHLLVRILGQPFSGDEEEFSLEEINHVHIVNDTIYRHKVVRINFTTYDLRREQDSLNPRTHADVMVLAREDEKGGHPFWYCRIIGAFHARILYHTPDKYTSDSDYQNMDFLWVRWFGPCLELGGGWEKKRLHRLSFINPETDDTPLFGFLDPACVLRGVYLIPAFHHGRSDNGIPGTIGRPESDEGQDYNYYDINMFVDRDMFMCYRGGGIGHREIWDALSVFRNDRDPIDLQMRAIAASNYQTAQHEEDSEEEFDVMQIEGAGGNLNDKEGDDEEYERVEIVQTVSNEEDVEGGEVLDEKEVGDELGAEDGEVEDNGFGGLAYAPL
ncbi:hypothetical protein EST38_g14122, partial [Candolleomyces aberdarensis]